MKSSLKHLLPLLFALSMVFASCNKNNPTDGNGYLYNEVLTKAMRLSSAEHSLPENYHYLRFSNSTDDKGVDILLVGSEEETILRSGTYSASDNNLLVDKCAVFAGSDFYQCTDGNGTVVVTGDIDNYSFDIELSDGKEKFHFTYSGTVEGMDEQVPELPDNNVYFTATSFVGMHMSFGASITSYVVQLSNIGQDENGNTIPGTIFYQLALYNVLGEVDDEGYVTLPSGTYTHDNSMAEFTIASHSNHYTVNSDGSNNKTSTFDEATLVVTEAQSILTAVIEGVTHIVTYNGPIRMIADLPAEPVDLEAHHAYAYYSNDIYGTGEVDLFVLYLSDLGLDADGKEIPNGTYYKIDLLVNSLEPGAETAIPAGTYKINPLASTVGSALSGDYYKLDESGNDVTESGTIWGGYITINEDGTIIAEYEMLISGAVHTVTFSGEIKFVESDMPTESPYSTLTEDKDCDFSNHILSYTKGSYPHETGCETWSVLLAEMENKGDHVSFELLGGEYGKTDIFGKYTVSDSMGAYTILPGYISGFSLSNSWYYYRDNPKHISGYAPIVNGWVEITDNNDGTATLTFDVYDDLNNHITGTWTGSNSLN